MGCRFFFHFYHVNNTDLLACGHTPGEGHLSDVRVVAEYAASLLAALHHVEQPLWSSSLVIDLCQQGRSHRCQW